MDFVTRTKIIDANLGNLTIKEIMNFPPKKNIGSGEFYVNKVFTPNHIQIFYIDRFSSIHDLEYDTETKKIKIFSRYYNSAFTRSIGVVLFFIIGVLGMSTASMSESIVIVVCFIVFVLVLTMGAKSNSKEIERELMIRINYLRRNKKIK